MIEVAPVLLVDDDDALREIIQAALANEGYPVLCADSGEHALEILERVDPAMLIVDVMMPRMSGPMLVHELQRRGRINPYRIVMISAFPVAGFSEAKWRLTKPLNLELLLSVVTDFCGYAPIPANVAQRLSA